MSGVFYENRANGEETNRAESNAASFIPVKAYLRLWDPKKEWKKGKNETKSMWRESHIERPRLLQSFKKLSCKNAYKK